MSGSEWIVGECGPARWFPSQHQIFPCLLLTDGFHSQRKVRCLGGGGCRERAPPGSCFHWFSPSQDESQERDSHWHGQPGLLRTSPVKWRHNITLHLVRGGCEWQDQRMVLTDQLYCHPIHSLWKAVSEVDTKMIMTPWEDLFFVINNLLLGEEPVSPQTILLDLDFDFDIFSQSRTSSCWWGPVSPS